MGLLFMNKDALVMLGCPKFPVQTSLALYMGHKLVGEDILPVFAGNKSAIALLEIADPEGRYRGGGFMDLDEAVGALSEGRLDFDLCVVFVHSDPDIAYLATVLALSDGLVVAIVFGGDVAGLKARCREVGCDRIVAARAIHNPLPLKEEIDGVNRWLPV
ncbi:hypothetical protein B6U67_04695 [Methanosarcinales archaeon ex4484_138]|nr:MAG: hypothetical protein B6U67_04695 [Methanosarcinales archaeon ex4484_138]RLG25266.1 MAG: DUF1890 domain-containing protein [Methanosarcinales archaeon]RLG26000.1 MAG: DUF1890 domain-containing protein [Methanosarcinales archaeon]HHI30645.1 DUF1890 domain-containing protein [Candidatus Methanoperedenaceae archaeon]